jgi:hypothetical protein
MYIDLQNKVIADYKINIVQNSTCWRRMHAHCSDKSRRVCKWKQAESYNALYDLLHEIGHIETWKSSMKRAESESAATLWANKKIKELGLPLKRKYCNRYKEYIAMTYQRGLRRGLSKRIKSKLYM